MDQAEKSIKAPLMVFVDGRDAERRAHALSCELSLCVPEDSPPSLWCSPERVWRDSGERERERRRRHGETGIEKRDVDGQISLEQRKAEEHNPVE